MEVIRTGGQDSRFAALSQMLNNEYLERFGEVALGYQEYNTLEDIHHAVLILDHNNPVCCGSFKQFDSETAEIKRVFVKKDYRGQGLGRKVMGLLEGWAKEEGYRYAVLETGVDLHPAVSLYRSLGYEVIENCGPFEGDAICMCMKKGL